MISGKMVKNDRHATIFYRELSVREKEILNMIRPTSLYDIVDIVRMEIDQSRYNARRELRELIELR